MFNRADAIDQNFSQRVLAGDLPERPPGAAAGNAPLTAAELADLFDTQLMSRHLDLMARRAKGRAFYSIGSSGHEGMAALAKASRLTDMAFLHYRDAAFLLQRKKQVPGAAPLYDMALSFAAAADDPVSGGRHKVLGGKEIFVPPQTSTIASHLPKAVGAAHSIALAKKLAGAPVLEPDAVVLCSFGDASANHSTAQGAINAACWAAYQNQPMPIVFICEDNGIGISVKTPPGWIEAAFSQRPSLAYMACNGLDIEDAHRGFAEAIGHARRRRAPVFVHLRTVRLMGHAGADIEAGYAPLAAIEAAERDDPLLHSARILMERQAMSAEEIVQCYETMRARVSRVAEDAFTRPKLETAEEVMASILPSAQPDRARAPADPQRRETLLGKDAAAMARPQPLARHINYALADLMLERPEICLFGEDVGRKGGVYGVTQSLQAKFGPARVFDTLLDEQTILGLAIGMAHNGLLPVPEIQFLAYLHNAADQIRGEAATLPFFSRGQYDNPMVVRIAGLAYQRGFGGHFHNDNAIAALRDIPGVVVACPSSPADAGPMLREAMDLAAVRRRVVVFLEPIALYQTADLHEDGDGLWASVYQPPVQAPRLPLGETAAHGEPGDVTILTYGNGHLLSRQAQRRLAAEHGLTARVVDLRWLKPLPDQAILDEAARARRILVVDECRRTGGPSEEIMTLIAEAGLAKPLARIAAEDSFIPLGAAAYHVLPSADRIAAAALALCRPGAGAEPVAAAL